MNKKKELIKKIKEYKLEKDGNLLTDGEIANLIRIIVKETNHE